MNHRSVHERFITALVAGAADCDLFDHGLARIQQQVKDGTLTPEEAIQHVLRDLRGRYRLYRGDIEQLDLPRGHGSVDDAIREGDEQRRLWLDAMPALPEAADLAGISPRELAERVDAGLALAFVDGDALRFPPWQFEPYVRHSLPFVLKCCSSPWNAFVFYVDGDPLLPGDGSTLDYLKDGGSVASAKVIEIAQKLEAAGLL